MLSRTPGAHSNGAETLLGSFREVTFVEAHRRRLAANLFGLLVWAAMARWVCVTKRVKPGTNKRQIARLIGMEVD